jgi:hypothetical protein
MAQNQQTDSFVHHLPPSGRPFVLLFAVLVFIQTVREILRDRRHFCFGNGLAVRSHERLALNLDREVIGL